MEEKTVARARAKAPAAVPLRLRGRETGVLVALIVMCVALTLLNDRFLTSTNLLNIGR